MTYQEKLFADLSGEILFLSDRGNSFACQSADNSLTSPNVIDTLNKVPIIIKFQLKVLKIPMNV